MSFSKQVAVLFLGAGLALGTLAVPFLPQRAYAQATSGNVTGTVVDASGAVVANATVTATNIATDVAATTTSNSNGEYRIENLPNGKYNVSATASGFSRYTLQGLDIELNKTTTAKLTLSVASASTSVEVSAEAASAIDTTTAYVQQSFESKQLQDLPTATNGLGVLNLSLLAPGVGSSGGIGAGTGPSIGGQRPRNNNYTIEGIDNNNKSVTGPLINVPNDAVSEFTLLTNQFSPEFGHSTGGQFNVAVVSGTNSFHGRAYEYFQNRNLNAIDASVKRNGNLTNPRFDDNRFGGQVGGPILKNKLFFFSNFEYQPIGQALTGGVCTPTAAGFQTLSSISGLNQTNLAEFAKYTPPATITTDDALVNYCSPVGPGTDLHHAAVLDTNGTPVPIEIGELSTSGSTYTNNTAFTGSGDWTISPKDNARLRYIYNKTGTLDSVASLPAFWQTTPYRYQLVAISEYHNFTPTIGNEARIGYNRYYNDTPSGNYSFPGLDMFPNLTFYDLGGLNVGPDGNAPQGTIQNLYQFTDNVSWVKGRHSLKFGFEGRKYISPQSFTQRVRGDYQWGTGDENAPYGLSDYLHDLAPTSFGERSSGNFSFYGDQTAWYGFANDSWRVSPTVTLNFGLRYEFTSVPYGEREQVLNSAASVPGLISFTAPQPQYKNFLPRIGIAWAPGNGDWSIRGGFGMGVDVLYDNLGILSLPPQYSSTQDVGNTGYPAPGDPNFLADGGLPPGTGGLQTFPDVITQRENTSAYVPNQQLPYSEQWNIGVQHAFAKNYTAEVRYLGTRGIHLTVQQRLNRQAKVSSVVNLPTFFTDPGSDVADTLPMTLADFSSISNYVSAYSSVGFDGASVVGFMPYGASNYNGLQAQLQRRFERGLQFNLAYTWSRTMDNSTADVFSTVLSPRRAQDWNNFAGEYSRSALDHPQRFTAEVIYDLPFLKSNHNWVAKNLLGNWEIAPIYTYQSPEWGTVQTGADANLNGDAAGDRSVINPKGNRKIGSGNVALYSPARASLCGEGVAKCSANLVGYVAADPDAYYVSAGSGAFANGARNSLAIRPINDWDVTALKRVNITERYNVEFQAQAFNVFNHSQYISGSINNINSIGDTAGATSLFLRPNQNTFNHPELVFPNNARTMQLGLKFIF